MNAHDNFGFGKANNLGLKKALQEDYDFILLLNQDCYLHEDAITEMLRYYDRNVGIKSLIHLNGKGDALDASFYAYLKKDECNNRLLMDSFFGRKQEFYDWGFVNAAY